MNKISTWEKTESEVNKIEYVVIFTHEQIRSLIKWIPKNYDSDDELANDILTSLTNAPEATGFKQNNSKERER